MPVYMIRAGQSGPVKIGHTGDITKRLYELQTAHWETLQVIRMFEGGALEETQLHLRFLDLHIRGEWHSFSRVMLGDVGLTEVPDDIMPQADPPPLPERTALLGLPIGARIAVARKSAGMSQRDLAAALGVSPGAVGKWEAFGTGIQYNRLTPLASILGVTVDWLFAGADA